MNELPLVRFLRRACPAFADALVPEVAKAVVDPTSYRRDFATRLGQRGPIASKDLAWIALVDALIEGGIAVELDGRDEPSAVRTALGRLSNPLPRVRVASSATVSEALDIFARGFAKDEARGMSLVHLDLRSDSEVVALVPREAVESLIVIAHEAGQRVELLPRAMRVEAAPRQEIPTVGPRWQRLLHGLDPLSRHIDGVLWRLLANPRALDQIYAARDDAPAEDQPLIDAVVELFTSPNATEAQAALPPAMALRALRYHPFEPAAAARAKIAAVHAVCERLWAMPGGFDARSEAAALLSESLVVWVEDAAREVLGFPADTRERLARSGDALLVSCRSGGNPFVQSEDRVYRLLRVVGDMRSACLIEQEAERVDEAILSFAAREACEWIARRQVG